MRTADTQSIVRARKGSYDLIEAFKALPNEVRARARPVFAGDRQVEDLRELASEYQDPVTVHSWINRAQRDRLRAESLDVREYSVELNQIYQRLLGA